MLHSEQLPILADGPAPAAPKPSATSTAKTCKDADASEPTRHTSRYWRSVSQMKDTDEFREFLHREFPAGASVFDTTGLDDVSLADDGIEGSPEGKKGGMSRRRLMQLMGASAALAAAGCRWEEENIVPLTYRPEDRVPGRPQLFATAWELDGVARPLYCQKVDGRPIKLEGNPEHPFTRGGTDVYDQGALLGMYDPDRLDAVIQRGSGGPALPASDWPTAEALLEGLSAVAEAQPGSVAVIAEPTSSLVMKSLRKEFDSQFPGSQWVTYSPVGTSNERVGLKAASGSAVRPIYDLAKADVVVSIDADPLGTQAGSHGYIRDWASRRTPESGAMNRTYAFESGFTCTGMSADHRAGVKSGDMLALVEALGSDGGDSEGTVVERITAAAASDLAASNGKSAVICGPHLPPAVHAAVAKLNEQLGNVGQTVRYVEVEDEPSDLEALAKLSEDMIQGRVKAVVILGGNPVYHAPAELELPKALQACQLVIRHGLYEDETALLADWSLPATHAMEEWDLLRAFDGSLVTCQPMLPDRVTDGRSATEIVAAMLGKTGESVRDLFYAALSEAGVEGSDAVEQTLHRGFVTDSAPQAATVSFSGDAEPYTVAEGLEVVLTPSPTIFDGRFANNGWLQETPSPVTRTVWTNSANIAPSLARDLDLEQGDEIVISKNGRSVTAAVYILPGQAPGSIGLQLGYGRRAAGVVGGNYYGEGNFYDPEEGEVLPVGVDVTPLKSVAQPSVITGVEVTKAGSDSKLVTVQDHFAIDTTGLEGTADRIGELVREASEERFNEEPHFVEHMGPHHPPLESLWEEWDYEKTRRWGMSIDLSKCVGCGSCVTACSAENNIPVVGPDQVDRGREMHWLRVDRYFAFAEDDVDEYNLDNPRVVTQPVACHHCETAPCEQVCPVAATVHSYEGLNDMVYNRCIGTRYCANNCPYKVRRFNFFNYNKRYENEKYDLQKLVLNPEVTVRARGVMEKCTYCVQRIKNVTQYARNERRAVQDGEIKTACQTACPAEAIVFGDLSDPGSAVSEQHANPRAYAMLAELNVKPRTRYLARIRNLHPDLVDLAPDLATAGEHHGGHGDDHGEGHHDGEHHDAAHGDEHEPHQHHGEDHGDAHHKDGADVDHGDAINDEMIEAPSGKIEAPE